MYTYINYNMQLPSDLVICMLHALAFLLVATASVQSITVLGAMAERLAQVFRKVLNTDRCGF